MIDGCVVAGDGYRQEMHIRIQGKEYEIEYEHTGSYHHYHSFEHNVHTSDLKRDKSYEKFTKALTKAINNPRG